MMTSCTKYHVISCSRLLDQVIDNDHLSSRGPLDDVGRLRIFFYVIFNLIGFYFNRRLMPSMKLGDVFSDFYFCI
jgi:hypothetical protein